MSIQGTPVAGIRWLVDEAGAIIGYRNPVHDKDVAATFGADATNTAAQLAAMASAGTLVPYTTYVANDVTPASPQWARSATELVPLGGAAVSDGYVCHFYAPLACDSDTKARDISGALNDGSFQANLSAATAWATAGFLTQPNPSVASELSLVTFPAIQWDWSAGDSLFIFWMGRGTPENSDANGEICFLGDTTGAAAGSGIRINCGSGTGGKIKFNAYQNSPALTCYGPQTASAVLEAGVTHSFAVCFAPAGICLWVDGARNSGHSSGFLAPANAGLSTVNANTLKIGGDGSTLSSIQRGIALQTRAFVVLKGRRGKPPAVADLDALVAALHANPSALVSSSAW